MGALSSSNVMRNHCGIAYEDNSEVMKTKNLNVHFFPYNTTIDPDYFDS